MARLKRAGVRYFGPGGYNEPVPFDSYPTTYGDQELTGMGVPKGTRIPDLVAANKPPSLERQSKLAQGDISSKPYKDTNPNEIYNPNPPGVNQYSPIADFGLVFGPAQEAENKQERKPGSKLIVSPTGQYQQILAPYPKRERPKRDNSGSGGGGSSNRNKKRPKYADSEYLSEIKALERELADYRAKMGLNRTRAGTRHSLSERDLRQQKERDLEDLKNDFAARGIVLSGVYGDKLGEYNTLFGQQASALDRQYKDSLTDIQNQYKDFKREVGVQKEQARLAAIRRRAQKLGRL